MTTDIRFEHSVMPVEMVRIPPGTRVSTLIVEAGARFALDAGMPPEFAWMKTLPVGAQEFVEISGITLVLADWVPEGHVAVGRGGMEIIDEEFKQWTKA